jgi:hypothetical protein
MGFTNMKKTPPRSVEPADANLRVSKRTRARMKTAAAMQGRPLSDVTNEVIEIYLRGLNLPSLDAVRCGKRG